MSDVYEPWERLIRIVVLGKVFEVPEKNLLLRQMQYVAEDVGMGRYCWNAECRYCEVTYKRPGDESETAVGVMSGGLAWRCSPELPHANASSPKTAESHAPRMTRRVPRRRLGLKRRPLRSGRRALQQNGGLRSARDRAASASW